MLYCTSFSKLVLFFSIKKCYLVDVLLSCRGKFLVHFGKLLFESFSHEVGCFYGRCLFFLFGQVLDHEGILHCVCDDFLRCV